MLGDDWFTTLPPRTTDPFLSFADNLSLDVDFSTRFQRALGNSLNDLLQPSGSFEVAREDVPKRRRRQRLCRLL